MNVKCEEIAKFYSHLNKAKSYRDIPCGWRAVGPKNPFSLVVLVKAIPAIVRANGFLVSIQFSLFTPTTAALVTQQQRCGGYPQQEGENLDAQPEECQSFAATREWVAAMMTEYGVNRHRKCEYWCEHYTRISPLIAIAIMMGDPYLQPLLLRWYSSTTRDAHPHKRQESKHQYQSAAVQCGGSTEALDYWRVP